MPFTEMCNDSVTIIKSDGRRIGPQKCSVQGDEIYLFDGKLDVDDGDTVEREMPNNKTELYVVQDAQFNKGLHSIPDSWHLHCRKANRPPKQKTQNVTNIHIENAQGVQIGDHNLQQISSVLQSLVTAIEESDATPEEKEEAKSKRGEFLKHPALLATLGAGAAALVKTLLGG